MRRVEPAPTGVVVTSPGRWGPEGTCRSGGAEASGRAGEDDNDCTVLMEVTRGKTKQKGKRKCIVEFMWAVKRVSKPA